MTRMEIREQDKSILLEFQQDGALYVEWCDGLTRGGRELAAPEYRAKIRSMMTEALHIEKYKGSCAVEDGSLRAEVERGTGYYRITLAYVPEEDLMPWQWQCVSDYFRPAEYEALLTEI